MTLNRDWLISLGCRACGISLITAGAIFSISGFWAIFPHSFESGWRAWLDVFTRGLLIVLASLLIGGTISFLGVYVFNFGRRMVTPTAAEKLRRDPRCPILYLRSFSEDKLTRNTHMMVLPGLVLLRTLRTEEEQISRTFDRLGPVIAIGAPGEKLPPLGAARLQVPQEQWQAEVRALMAKAQLLLIKAGTTPGVCLEIRLSVEQNRPESLLLLVPVEQRPYESFRAVAQTFFALGLPPWPGPTPSRILHGLAIITFDEAWSPTYYRLKFREYSLAPFEGAFKRFIKKYSSIRLPTAPTAERVKRSGSTFLRSSLGLLLAAVVGVPLAFKAIPKVNEVAGRFQPHIFLASPVDRFVATLPTSLQDAVRSELPKAPAVRKWIEDYPSYVWPLFGGEARRGLERLPDDDLVDWSTAFQANLAARDAKSCATMVHTLADGESTDFIPILASETPQRLMPTLGRVLVRAAEAQITEAPLRPSLSHADREYVKSELLRFVASAGVKRFTETLISGPDRAGDADVCWFQMTWMKMIQETSLRSRSVVITVYVYSYYPDVWRRDANKRKLEKDDREETERLRRLFRF